MQCGVSDVQCGVSDVQCGVSGVGWNSCDERV